MVPVSGARRLAQIGAYVSVDLDEGVAEIVGLRAGGVASLVVGLDYQDPIAAGIANEFLYASPVWA